jgi:hypothetical protein
VDRDRVRLQVVDAEIAKEADALRPVIEALEELSVSARAPAHATELRDALSGLDPGRPVGQSRRRSGALTPTETSRRGCRHHLWAGGGHEQGAPVGGFRDGRDDHGPPKAGAERERQIEAQRRWGQVLSGRQRPRISPTNLRTSGSPGSMKCPPARRTVRESGIAAAMRSVTRRNAGGDASPATRSVGTWIRAKSASVASSHGPRNSARIAGELSTNICRTGSGKDSH